jgi:hypothetical protein
MMLDATAPLALGVKECMCLLMPIILVRRTVVCVDTSFCNLEKKSKKFEQKWQNGFHTSKGKSVILDVHKISSLT